MKRAAANPKKFKGITLALKEGTLSTVKKRMIEDGVSYMNDLVQILVLLWVNGRMSKKLKSAKVATASKAPFEEASNVRVRSEVLRAAHEGARRAGFDGVSELWRFLLEGYGEGRIELCLRSGKT